MSMSLSSSSSSPPSSVHLQLSTYHDLLVQQRLLFLDSLKELRNLRTQLYSAAEYFESSCSSSSGQKKMAVETLRDYVLKALVNSVDHLGSVTDKVNSVLDKKSKEFSLLELRTVCIEQRHRACQEYSDHEGLSQQSLAPNPPKYHKRYILPVGKTIHECGRLAIQKYEFSSPNKVIAESRKLPIVNHDTSGAKLSSFRKRASSRARSLSSSGKMLTPSPSLKPGKFAFIDTEQETNSLNPTTNMLPHSRSVSYRRSFRSVSSVGRSFSPESWKSMSVRTNPEEDNHIDIEQKPSKSRNMLKALLSRRKSKKDGIGL